MTLGSWRVAFRIAARSAWHAKGRTLLIAAMVGVPVTGLAAADTLYRTAQLNAGQQVQRQIGAADYVVTAEPSTLAFYVDRTPRLPADAAARERGMAEVAAAGAHVTRSGRGAIPYVSDLSGSGSAAVELADVADPMFAGHVVRRTGAVPAAPDEVVLTPALLADSGARVGATVRLGERDFLVVGTAVNASDVSLVGVYAHPDSALADVMTGLTRYWLVGTSDAATEQKAEVALARSGFAVLPREAVVDQVVERQKFETDAEVVGTAVVVVGLAGLQIVLLASAAFAVGARRQRRDLGLLAAQGGDRRHVRSVVLASGLVVGGVASVVGIALGIALAAALRTPFERFGDALYGPFDVVPLDLGMIALVGTGTALLASVVPARTASRVPVLAALSGRRGQTRTSRRVLAVGLVGVAAGAFLAWRGAQPPAHYNRILVGAVVAELGFALCAPAIVGGAGRLARWTPLPLRLALRDSARNRGRSGPAVAAVMAALAATVALSVFVVSNDARDRDRYVSDAPTTVVTSDLGYDYAGRPMMAPGSAEAVARALPDGRAHQVRVLGAGIGGCAAAPSCSQVWVERPSPNAVSEWDRTGGPVAVGDAGLVAVLTGEASSPDVAAALRAGLVVELGPIPSGPAGTTVLTVQRDGDEPRELSVPSVRTGDTTYQGVPFAVVSPETADRLGFDTVFSQALWSTSRPADRDEMRAAAAELRPSDELVEDMGEFRPQLHRETGFESSIGLILLGLVGVSVVVALGATAIATGLAAAESRPDLATLSAVGAGPGVRRALSMAQASSIAGTGAVLGLAAGLVPAFAILNAREDFPFVVPWSLVLAVVLGVPAVAAVFAGLFTRSRLPMQARIG